MRGFNIAPLLLIVAVAACTPAARESSELAAMGDRWEEAFNSGDADAVAALYAEDGRLLPPNAELGQGRDVARAAFAEMIASGIKAQLETIEAVVAGDLGHRVGTYSLHGPDGAVLDHGKYIETWRQIDGAWQIENDIWNSDLPAPFSGTNLIITHEVINADRWLAAWQGDGSRHEVFGQHGAPNVRTFQSLANPNLTGLLIDVADMDAFQAFMESPVAEQAKAEDGVKDATLRIFKEVK